MMKWILCCALAFLSLSCQSHSRGQSLVEGDSLALIGADTDIYGCNASAGETWSMLQGRCLQIFNEGIRLDPLEPIDTGAVISAFVLYNRDSTALELFLPEHDDNPILYKSDVDDYRDSLWVYKPHEGQLWREGKPCYSRSQD